MKQYNKASVFGSQKEKEGELNEYEQKWRKPRFHVGDFQRKIS